MNCLTDIYSQIEYFTRHGGTAAKSLNLVIFSSCIRPAPVVRAVREQECDLRSGIPERRSRFGDGEFGGGGFAPLARKFQVSLPDLIRQSIFSRSAMDTRVMTTFADGMQQKLTPRQRNLDRHPLYLTASNSAIDPTPKTTRTPYHEFESHSLRHPYSAPRFLHRWMGRKSPVNWGISIAATVLEIAELRHFSLGDGIFLRSFVLCGFSIVSKSEVPEGQLEIKFAPGSNPGWMSERN
jgi:hypothetical protein